MVIQYPLTTLATLLALAVCFLAGLLVARARKKYHISAPATSGNPAFERTFRAQQNVLEWMPLFLPALWIFALTWSDKWAAAIGLLWSLARIGYIFAYRANAEKRQPYFLAQLGAFIVLWTGGLMGILHAMF